MQEGVDLDGNPRILVGASSITVDIGAYEHRFTTAIARKSETDIELSWIMRPARSYTVLSVPDLTGHLWAEQTTISGGKSGGPATWIDVNGASTHKFYRIKVN